MPVNLTTMGQCNTPYPGFPKMSLVPLKKVKACSWSGNFSATQLFCRGKGKYPNSGLIKSIFGLQMTEYFGSSLLLNLLDDIAFYV